MVYMYIYITPQLHVQQFKWNFVICTSFLQNMLTSYVHIVNLQVKGTSKNDQMIYIVVHNILNLRKYYMIVLYTQHL